MRTLGAVAASCLLVAGLAGLARAGGHDAARERAEAARSQEQALADEIATQSAEIDAVEIEVGSARSELAGLERELAAARARLSALERELAEKTRTLHRAGRELAVAETRLGRRLVDIYTAERPDLVSVALEASSVEELVDVLETQEVVLDRDDELVTEIETLRARTRKERARTAELRKRQAATTAAVAARTSERRSILSGLVARRDELARLRAARRRSLASVRVERREWEAEAAALAAAGARVASVSAAPPVADAAVPPPSPSPGGFGWPLRGTVVSPFGQRWGRLHSGLDIAAPAGTPVVASAAGQVVFAGAMSGYGLLVVLQHGGGISTAYAHNASLAVSVGQTVAPGQTIASVGCTGRCFGDHVHFEVRAGGSAVDPMRYL